jgi:hypothetical protein
MATEQTNSNPTPVTGDWRLLWGRRLAVATAIVFSISALFPTVAAFVRDTEPGRNWWGVLDVSLAFFLAALAFAVLGLARGQVNKAATAERKSGNVKSPGQSPPGPPDPGQITPPH